MNRVPRGSRSRWGWFMASGGVAPGGGRAPRGGALAGQYIEKNPLL